MHTSDDNPLGAEGMGLSSACRKKIRSNRGEITDDLQNESFCMIKYQLFALVLMLLFTQSLHRKSLCASNSMIYTYHLLSGGEQVPAYITEPM